MELAWIALSLQPHIGLKTLRALQTHFAGDLAAALRADIATLQQVPGIGAKIARTITGINLAAVEQQLIGWQKAGIVILPYSRPDYPPLLRTLDDAPATLFIRGAFDDAIWHKTAAIVGTRTPSAQTRQMAFDLAARLVRAGYTIVSGLAVGIDSAAHAGALSADGRTAAVLGCGVLNIYPPENIPLAEKILHQGVIMSEVSPNTGVNAARLVARNRIISGLCLHVIVVDTTSDGGALYAARGSLSAGRGLLTIDLPLDGNQQLVAMGARTIPPDLSQIPFLQSK